MILSEISIKRPVVAIVFSALLIIAGVISFLRLQVRELPVIETASVSITTVYTGASPEIMEMTVTKVIEDELSGIAGIKNIISNSRSGKSWISVSFNQGVNMLEAVSAVRDAVSRARKKLPNDCDEPITTSDNGEEEVVLWLNLASSKMERVELSDYATNNLVPDLSIVDGVSQIKIVGGLEKVMYVKLMPNRMAALAITVNDITKAIGYENVELPSGEIRNNEMLFPVRIKRVYVDVESFEKLPIKRTADGNNIRLGDVAEVELKAKNEESIYHNNGISSIGIGIIPQANANPLEVSQNIRDKVAILKKSIPNGANLDVDYDSTIYISNSINEVYETLLITAILVIFVLYLFIGAWRTTIIPAITVPISLISAFIGAAAFSFSINIITLLSLILAVGLVVDDAIVLVENISYHLKKGEGKLAAIWLASQEVGFAIVATSVVLIMMFLPLMFMQGATGKMFIEFAALLALSVFFSSIVALTLSPALSVFFLKSKTSTKSNKILNSTTKTDSELKSTKDSNNANSIVFAQEETNLDDVGYFDKILHKIEKIYSKALSFVFKIKYLYGAIAVAILGIIWILFDALPHEFVPREDRGVIYIYAVGAEGASIHRMKRSMQELENKILPYVGNGIVQSISFSTPSLGQGTDQSGFLVLQLNDWKRRNISSHDFVNHLKSEFDNIPDLKLFIYEPGFKGSSGSPVRYVIRGNNYDNIYEKANALMNAAQKSGIIVNANMNYSQTTPEVEVVLDSVRASMVGVSLIDASKALQTALGGVKHTTFVNKGESYDVYLRADESEFSDLNSISSLNIRTEKGNMVSLGSIAEFKLQARAKRLPHYNRQKSITISAHPAPNVSLGEALDWLDNWSKHNLSSDMSTALTGESANFRENENGMILVLILAIVVAYLVLSAQFESFITPIVIMTTIPLGILGGFLGLWILGLGLNIYSEIGLLLLMGMVTKNGILIVEFANQLRMQGQNIFKATINASVRRLRPIMMTSVTAIIGALPLVIASGSGYESRQAVGAVIFFGMVVSTLITLFLVPSLYILIAKFIKCSDANEKQLAIELATLNKSKK